MSNQDGLIDFIKDPKNIAKAVEGSMDKRNEAMKQKISIDEILDRYVAAYHLDVLGFRESGQATLKQALLEQLLSLMPEKRDKSDDDSEQMYNFGYNQALDEVEKAIKEYING